MNCLCGGLSIGTKVSAMDAAGLDAEVEALARVNSMVIARRSLVIAELARRHGDVAERLRNSGNMSSRQARKASKTASGLDRLPKTRKALERGEIGAEQAEQMASRMDKPELARNVRDNEDALLEKAKAQNADDFARTMRQEDIDGSPDGGKTHEQRQRQGRKASMWVDDDTGMHHLFAQFDPVTGARISTQLAAMTDQLWRAEHLSGALRHNKRMVAQRRADALESLICRPSTSGSGRHADTASTTGTVPDATATATARTAEAATGNNGPTATNDTDDANDTAVCRPQRPTTSATGPQTAGQGGGLPSEAEGDTKAGQSSFNFDSNGPSDDPIAANRSGSTPPPHPRRHRRSDPTTDPTSGNGNQTRPCPTPGTGSAPVPAPAPTPPDPIPPAPNPTQLMVIANLDALRQHLVGGSLPDGTPLSAEAVATLACDAEVLPAIFDTTGQPLWLGRSQRLATSAQRAAVTARDRGCIVCGTAAEWCQVHHINWWSQGGKADLDNLCLLRSKHHHRVHEHGLTISTTPEGFKVQPRSIRPVPIQPSRSGEPDGVGQPSPSGGDPPATQSPATPARPSRPSAAQRRGRPPAAA